MKESRRASGTNRSGTQCECPGNDPDEQCRVHGCARWRCGGGEASQSTGVDELRRAVRVLNECEEAFNQDYTAEQLLQIVRMHMRSEWTIYPDQWTDRQVREALRGRPPTWNAKTEDAEYDTEVEGA